MEKPNQERRIIVADTTLRDGAQAPGCRLSPGRKIDIARQLHRLGVDVIETGFPVSSPAEFAAVEAIAREVGCAEEAPEIEALARSVPGDIDAAWAAVRGAKRPRIHVFIAASDIHLEHKLRMTRKEAIQAAVAGVRRAKRYTDSVQFSPEDAIRADRAFLFEMIHATINAGATTVNVPDTVGYATPSEMAELIGSIRVSIGQAPVVLSAHCHDDLGMAVANSIAGVAAGAGQIEATINGIGERAGNAALEEVVMALNVRRNVFQLRTGIRTPLLVETSRLVSDLMGFPTAVNKAIVGENAFAHTSGIHQDGVLKNQRTYEIMDPAGVGFEGSRLPLTARSGRRALEDRFRRMGIRIDTDRLKVVFERFKTVADRQWEVGDDDLRRLVRDVA